MTKSELYTNVQKNGTTPLVLPCELTVCKIYVRRVTDLVGEIIRKKKPLK